MVDWVQQIVRLFERIDALAVLDIGLVALIIYWLLSVLSGTRAMQVFRGVIIVLVFFVVGNAILPPTLKFLVNAAFPATLLAIPIIFQPELRRALEQIGHTGDWLNRPLLSHRSTENLRQMVEEVVAACNFLSNQHWGGLMVIERGTGLQDISQRGVQLDAVVTSQLLTNIFTYGTPLHDGAAIIREGRIVAAAVVLPLTENYTEFLGNGGHRTHGTRHRAAVGVSEQSDAIAIVVSEETGAISVAYNGKLLTNLSTDKLRRLLSTLMKLDTSARRSDPVSATRPMIRTSIESAADGESEPAGHSTKPAATTKTGSAVPQ